MTMVALLMRPWLLLMRSMSVEPRCLADDLLILSVGAHHERRYVDAMKASRGYFQIMEAKVADKKCFSFATDAATRLRLRKRVWEEGGVRIPVVNHFRDLGTSVNLTAATAAPTMRARLDKAIAMARRIRGLPVTFAQKQRVVQANVHTPDMNVGWLLHKVGAHAPAGHVGALRDTWVEVSHCGLRETRCQPDSTHLCTRAQTPSIL